MDTRKLRHILSLYKHGTFSKAAEEVHLSQPALTRSIQAAESELGIRLFDRNTREVRLTPHGKAVIERIKRLVSDEKELHRQIELAHTNQIGEIALGFGPTPATLLLRPILSKFAVEFPRVRVSIETSNAHNLLKMLLDEHIDAFIADVHQLPLIPEFEVDHLPRWPASFFCRNGHPLLEKREIEGADLFEYPVASVRLSDWALDTMLRAFGLQMPYEEMICTRCDDFSVLKQVMLESDSIVIASVPVLWAEIQDGQVNEIPLKNRFDGEVSFGLVRLTGRTVSPLIGVVRNMATEIFSQHRSNTVAWRR